MSDSHKVETQNVFRQDLEKGIDDPDLKRYTIAAAAIMDGINKALEELCGDEGMDCKIADAIVEASFRIAVRFDIEHRRRHGADKKQAQGDAFGDFLELLSRCCEAKALFRGNIPAHSVVGMALKAALEDMDDEDDNEPKVGPHGPN